MKSIPLFFALGACLMALSGCTMIPDATTRVYVYDKVKSIRPGNTPAQVQYLLDGPPTHVSAMRTYSDTFELWEYKVGNFLYSQAPMILFKNQRVIALPKNGFELAQILNHYQVIQDAQFWTHRDA